MAKLESKVQREILNYLNEQPNLFVYKIILANKRGIPDIQVCYKGRFISLEVKQVGKEAEPLQAYNIKQIEKAGGIAVTVYSLEEVIEVLKKSVSSL